MFLGVVKAGVSKEVSEIHEGSQLKIGERLWLVNYDWNEEGKGESAVELEPDTACSFWGA